MDKDMKKLFKALEDQGFELFTLRTGHVRVTIAGTFVTVFGGTISDWRGARNSIAACKRFGFIWPPP